MSSKHKSVTSVNGDQTGGATDQVGEGPRDIAGAAASELADQGRGPVETNIGKEMGRKLPQETGEALAGNAGPTAAKAGKHAGGKRH
jgi:hypothetical protein